MGHGAKIFLLITFVIAVSPSYADASSSVPEPTLQERKRIFAEKDYNNAEFKVTKKVYTYGNLIIEISQVKRVKRTRDPQRELAIRDSPPELPDYCRAWLSVKSGETELQQFYYDDIHPVGSAFGLFVPKHQPSQDYFVVVGLGGY
ncbi:MAG TPA: hypothetical protein VFU48_05905, partial [Nitrospira sp.]|nr:hypothetical protein [Nitrospira sp.]